MAETSQPGESGRPAPVGPARHTPEAGWTRIEEVFGDRIPKFTPEIARQVDDLIDRARQLSGAARRDNKAGPA